MSKKISKIILRAVEAILFFALIGYIVNFFIKGDVILKNFLETKLQQAADARVSIESVDTNVLSRAVFRGIQIRKNGESIMEIKKIAVGYSIINLAMKNYSLSKLEIEGLKINARNLDMLGGDKKKQTPVDRNRVKFQLMNVLIKDSVVVLDNKETPVDIELKKFNGSISAGKDRMVIDLIVENGYADFTEKVEFRRLEARGSADKDSVKVREFLFTGMDLDVRGVFEMVFNSRKFNVSLKAEGGTKKAGDLLKKGVFKNIPEIAGSIKAEAEAQGFFHDFAGKASLVSNELDVDKRSFRDVDIAADFDKNSLFLKKCSFIYGNGEFFCEGKVYENYNKFLVSADFNNADISSVLGGLNIKSISLKGEAGGSINAKGRLDEVKNIDANASVRLRELSYRDRSIGGAHVNFDFRDRKLDLALKHSDAQLTYTGKFSRDTVDGKITVKNLDAEDYGSLFGVDGLKGRYSFNGDIEGEVKSPEVYVEFSSVNPGWEEYVLNKLQGKARYENKRIELIDLDALGFFEQGDFKFKKEDNIGFKGDVLIDLSEKKIEPEIHINRVKDDSMLDFSFVDFVFDYAGGYMSVNNAQIRTGELKNYFARSDDIEGQLIFSGEVKEFYETPLIDAKFSFKNPGYRDLTTDEVYGSIKVGKTRVLIENLAVRDEQGVISFKNTEAEISRKKQWDLRFKKNSRLKGVVISENFALSNFKFLLPGLKHISGDLNCRINLAGFLRAPNLNGRLSIQQGSMDLLEQDRAIKNINTEIIINENRYIIESLKAYFENKVLQAQGYVENKGWKEFYFDMGLSVEKKDAVSIAGALSGKSVDVSLRMDDFDLAFVGKFIPWVEGLNGRVSSKVKILRNSAGINIDGTLKGREVSFKLEYLDQEFAGGNFDLRFNRSSLAVNSFNLNSGRGSLSVRGNINNMFGDDIKPDLYVDIKNLGLKNKKAGQILIRDSGINITGEEGRFLVKGDIGLGKSRIDYPVHPVVLLFEKKRPVFPPEHRFVNQIFLDLRVRSNNKLWIDNNIAYIRIDSNLFFDNKLVNPRITGRVSVPEGYIRYVDRRFEVKQGLMDFTGEVPFNPVLDVRAEAKVTDRSVSPGADYTVTLEIKDRLRKARFNLKSQPSLNEASIITLLTLGATRESLTKERKELSAGELFLERAKMLTSERISGYVSTRMEEILALDRVLIQGNLFNIGPQETPVVKATKKITRRANLTYTTTVGHANEQGIELGYELTDNLAVESRTNRQGASNIGLKFNIRLR